MIPTIGTSQAASFDPVRWAEIVIERWEEKIVQLGIVGDNLINSFTQQVITDSNGDPTLIIFAFNYYGKFVDMGVGRGVPLSEVPFSNRRAKPWQSKTFARELGVMAELLSRYYGHRIGIAIANRIDGN